MSTIAKICDVSERPTIPGPAFEDPAYWARLELFQLEVTKRAFDAVREIIRLLEDNISGGISLGACIVHQIFWTQMSS